MQRRILCTESQNDVQALATPRENGTGPQVRG